MSDKVTLTASPFIISKSILKHPIKDPNSRFHVQTKQKNLHLFINKKHSELQSLFGLSSRNHAISYVASKLVEQAGPQGALRTETEASDQSKDPFSHGAYKKRQEKEKEEAIERKRKIKKMKMVTREQKLRAYVYRYVIIIIIIIIWREVLLTTY